MQETFAIVARFDWLSNQKSQMAEFSYIDIVSSNCKASQVIKNNQRLVPTLLPAAWYCRSEPAIIFGNLACFAIT